MSTAPNRGGRKCGTCLHYADIQHELEAGCKLAMCECRAQDKTFGIALCPNYKNPRYLDHSNHGDIGGRITGYCEWKCPPVMRHLLQDQWQYRAVNADGSWCHCWEPVNPPTTIPTILAGAIEGDETLKLTTNKRLMLVETILSNLRNAGWYVAVHNDYRQNGAHMTFWLFTHASGLFIKGEGWTDLEALEQCDRQARKAFAPSP